MNFEKRAVEGIYIFLLVDKEKGRVLDGNRLAKNYYCWAEEPPALEDIFMKVDSIENPLENLEEEESMRLYGITSVKATGEKFLCDIELCYTDKEKKLVFLVIKDRMVDSNQSLLEVVELVDNPVVVLNLDQKLTVQFGSYKFYQSIRQTKKGFQETYDGSYGNFLEGMRGVAFSKTVQQQLSRGAECHVDIEISYDGYYYHLFYLNAFQSQVDGRLYGVLIRLRNPSVLVKRIAYDQQFIDVIQEFSKDLLFRVDVVGKTLLHRGDVSKFHGLLPEMEDFPESIGDSGWIHPEDLEFYTASIYRMMHGQGADCELRVQLKCGKYEKYRLQGKPLFNDEGKAVQLVGRMENIQKYTEIVESANYDRLTGTLDESSFQDLVGNILSRAVQYERHGLLILEFEEISAINGKFGVEFGDFLLEAVGRRIVNSTRNLDKIGRLGGSKFGVFFHHVPSESALLERGNSILHAMGREFHNGTHGYQLNCRVGIAMSPQHGETYGELWNKATLALSYAASHEGLANLYQYDFED